MLCKVSRSKYNFKIFQNRQKEEKKILQRLDNQSETGTDHTILELTGKQGQGVRFFENFLRIIIITNIFCSLRPDVFLKSIFSFKIVSTSKVLKKRKFSNVDTLSQILDVIVIRTWISSGYIFNVVGTWFELPLSFKPFIFTTVNDYQNVLLLKDASFYFIFYI